MVPAGKLAMTLDVKAWVPMGAKDEGEFWSDSAKLHNIREGEGEECGL